jgi:hypothetical protein
LLGGCIDVVQAADVHELNGTDMMSLSCSGANIWQDCPDPAFPNPDTKVFERPDTCSFEPITVYAGVTCSTFGLTFEEGQSRAMDQLAMGEQRALEGFFLTRFLQPTVDTNSTDLTPAAGALSVAQGVAVLEMWLAANFGGAGVLHAPAGLGALLSYFQTVDFVTAATPHPTTLAGNCVILGAGYDPSTGPDGTTATAAGETWIYITPAMRIRRDLPFLPVTNEGSSLRSVTNDRFALAETTFTPEVSCCIAAAVRVSLAAC